MIAAAPNARNFSRVWRVWSGVLLQTWVICLAFGGFWVVLRSKRGEFSGKCSSSFAVVLLRTVSIYCLENASVIAAAQATPGTPPHTNPQFVLRL